LDGAAATGQSAYRRQRWASLSARAPATSRERLRGPLYGIPLITPVAGRAAAPCRGVAPRSDTDGDLPSSRLAAGAPRSAGRGPDQGDSVLLAVRVVLGVGVPAADAHELDGVGAAASREASLDAVWAVGGAGGRVAPRAALGDSLVRITLRPERR